MRIYTSDNGEVYVNAISKLADSDKDVDGHVYQLTAGANQQEIRFQLGTVPEAGHNGTTNEAIIAMVVHRLRLLNQRFPCFENGMAIAALEDARHRLDTRTRARIARGVEGKHQD